MLNENRIMTALMTRQSVWVWNTVRDDFKIIEKHSTECYIETIGFDAMQLKQVCGSPIGKFKAEDIFFSNEELIKSQGFDEELFKEN